jgi:flagella basal body P-ring formation protein FlgA
MPIAALIQTALLALPGLMPPAELQAQVEAFVGKPALVDPRLLLPACARPDFAVAAGGRSVMVRCTSPDWRVFVPVGEGGAVAPAPATLAAEAAPVGLPRAQPAVRRGDQVTVEIGGDGFVIGMAAIADADARDGRVALRATAGGRRLFGFVGDDGRVRLRDSSRMVNSR